MCLLADMARVVGPRLPRYVLTLHRPTTEDNAEQLRVLLEIVAEFSNRRTMVVPLHPRTGKSIKGFGLDFLVSAGPENHGPARLYPLLVSAH